MNMDAIANLQQSLGAKMASIDEPVVKDSQENLDNLKDNKNMVKEYLQNKNQVNAIINLQEETKEPIRSRQWVYSADDSDSSLLLDDRKQDGKSYNELGQQVFYHKGRARIMRSMSK